MQTRLAAFLHDAAVLYTFAHFIEEYCKEQARSQRYVDASGDFFSYSESVARHIKLKVQDDLDRAQKFPQAIAPSRIDTLRRNALTFKDYLRLLHTLIKPAADADTLSIPAPLVNLACDHLQQIDGMDDSRVAVLLTPELMYFQRPHSHVKQQAAIVGRLIPEAKKFPSRLGFIELPYSQGPGFFTNLAIYHEMGHFVYEELSTSVSPRVQLRALEQAIDESVIAFVKLEKKPRALAEKILDSWTQEIFCDLLALYLVGPAFSFALVEIFALLGSLSWGKRTTFSQEHPAPACRFAEHLRFLRDASTWWRAIAHIQPRQKKLIEEFASIPRSQYGVYDGVPKALMGPFLDSIVPRVGELVRAIAPNPKLAAKRFEKTRREIEDCLSVGVVPHVSTGSPPDPVSIINAAFCFYLTSLPDMVGRFEGPGASANAEKRSKWTRKLEDWTMKAIEDSQVRTQFEKRMQSDDPQQEGNS
jgi:hypothetical protein